MTRSFTDCALCAKAPRGRVHQVCMTDGRDFLVCGRCYTNDAAAEEAIRRRCNPSALGPNATRDEVNAWMAALPAPIPHELPPCEHGPSPVCNACELVQVSLFTSFCKTCTNSLEAAGVLA